MSVCFSLYIIFFSIPLPNISIFTLHSRQTNLVSYSQSPLFTFLLLCTNLCHSLDSLCPLLPVNTLYLVKAKPKDHQLHEFFPTIPVTSYCSSLRALSKVFFFFNYYLKTFITSTHLPSYKMEDGGHFRCLSVSLKAERTWISKWWGIHLGAAGNILGTHGAEFFSVWRNLFLDKFNVSPWHP